MPVEALADFYREEIVRQGWQLPKGDMTLRDNNNFYFFGCEKGSRKLGVQGSGDRSESRVFITVNDKAVACPCAALPPDPEAVALLESMRKAYAEAKTYTDTGTSTMFSQDLVPSNHPSTPRVATFCTAFAAPTKFRFESGDRYRYIVHRDGDTFRSYSSEDGEEKTIGGVSEGLGLAFVYAPDAVYTVPELLGQRPLRSHGMEFPRIIGDESIDETPCKVIEYYDDDFLPARIWIAPKDHTVRRTETYDHMYKGTWRKVTDYAPQLGQPLPEERLAFNTGGFLDLPNEPSVIERTGNSFARMLDYWF